VSAAITVIKRGGPMDRAAIDIWISDHEIGLEMAAEDYLRALAREIGNPTLLVTSTQLERRIREAHHRVITGMKQETVQIVAPPRTR
jgi:hypothetical protein